MSVKKILILLFANIITVGLVIVLVMSFRIKQATENPVEVFFGKDIEVKEIVVDNVIQNNAIIEVDLVRDQKSYSKKDNIVNIVILGRDLTPVKEQRADGGNTDIMIILAIDLDSKDVKAISIPRDTVAHMYHYNSKEEIDGEFFDKINSAYSAGGSENDDAFQVKNSVSAIQEYLTTFGTFEMEINNYVELGLTGLRELTDKVGGVEIVLNNGIPGVGSRGQQVHLTGKTAMTYIRDRHNSGGDLGRVSNAQVYVKALAKKMQSVGVKEVVPKVAGSLIKGNLMRTDLTLEEIAALAGLLEQINVDGIVMQTVDSIEVNDIIGIKKHLDTYPYDFEAFYGAKKWKDLTIKTNDAYDAGVFSEYYSLEEIMINTYYEEVITN